MALKIRLRQQGRNNYQTYRLVVIDSGNPRDGKYVEMLGWYNPGIEGENFSVNAERVHHWIGLGAIPSERVIALLRKAAPTIIQEMNAKKAAKKLKGKGEAKKVEKPKEAAKVAKPRAKKPKAK